MGLFSQHWLTQPRPQGAQLDMHSTPPLTQEVVHGVGVKGQEISAVPDVVRVLEGRARVSHAGTGGVSWSQRLGHVCVSFGHLTVPL